MPFYWSVKVARYGEFVKRFVAWGFHRAVLSHPGRLSQGFVRLRECTQTTWNDRAGKI